MEFKTKIEEQDTLEIVNSSMINWNFFKNSTVLVTGATGLIGTQIVLSLLCANEKLKTNIKILALVRNKEKAENKFKNIKTDNLEFVIQNILEPINCKKADFIIHTANSTASKDFVETPVETIDTIVLGTKNILEYAKNNSVKSVVYLSSMEVYGNIPLERINPIKEEDLGYMDTMKTRNSYPLGKRLAENMCYSYFSEYKIPVKIARLSQTIGAGVDYNDNRVFVQFARNVIEHKNIILHTKGETTRSYCYITDTIIAILLMIEKGRDGEAYNIANPDTTCSIREIAEMLEKTYPTSKLQMEINEHLYPDTTKYYLDTTKYYLDTDWKAKIGLEEMFERLIINLKGEYNG